MNSYTNRRLLENRELRGPGTKDSVRRFHRARNSVRRRVFTENNENAKKRDDEGGPSVKTEFVAETRLPTTHGLFRLRGYRHTLDNWTTFTEPTAIISGNVEGAHSVPLRVHDACFTSEVLGSLKCDCAQQLDMTLDYIIENPPGMVIYLQQEGRGIGLANKIAAYKLQETGLDTVDANRALGLPDDCREYSAVLFIMQDLGISSARLITNNPRKINQMRELGMKIDDRIPCLVEPGRFNQGYLKAKEQRMDHELDGSWCYWNHEGEPASPFAGNRISLSDSRAIDADSDKQ